MTTAQETRSASVGSTPPSFTARYGMTDADLAIVIVTLVLVVVFAPPLVFETWTPRFAIVLASVPLGLWSLAARARAGDLPARLGVASIAAAVVSALLSEAPRSALLGFAGRDLSTVAVAGCFGLWSLSQSASPRGRAVLGLVLVWSTAAGAAVGVAQVLLRVEVGSLALLGGRPSGLWVNPVYMGALCAGGLLGAVAIYTESRGRSLLYAAVLLGSGVSLSGSRIALASTVVLLVAHAALHRSRASWLGSALGATGLLVGVAIGQLRSGVGAGTDRLTDAGIDGRLQAWWYGLSAWLDRPAVGHGFGRFRPAVQGKFSDSFVGEFAPDELLQTWFDAHNVGIGLLVATGAVGTVLIAAWGVSVSRRVRGPLVWAAAAMGLTWLAQPVSLFTLPLVMLLLGAAIPLVGDPVEPTSNANEPIAASRAPVLLAAVGLVLGAYVVAADVGLRIASDDADGDGAARIASMYLADPVVNDIVAQIYLFQSDDTGIGFDESVDWRRRAAAAEPDRPYWWASLGYAQLADGDPLGARTSLERALRLQPNSVRSLRGLGSVAIEMQDEQLLGSVIDRFCDLGQPECAADPADVIANSLDR